MYKGLVISESYISLFLELLLALMLSSIKCTQYAVQLILLHLNKDIHLFKKPKVSF